MINSIVLMGRLVEDPILRTTTTGRSVASFRIAVDRGFVRAGEERKADFFSVTAWERQAEFVTRFFTKGSMIALQGSIHQRDYEDKTGAKRTTFEVNARELSFCGSKSEAGNSGAPAYPQAQTDTAPAPSFQTAGSGDFEEISGDDDLPF